MADVEVAVTPYEVSTNVDVMDPVERCREPRITVRKPGPPAKTRAIVKEKKADPKGVHPRLRKLRFPELFRGRFSEGLIASMLREHGEHAHVRVWIDEVIATGVPENQRRKFVCTKHPAFPQYDALFELVGNPTHGPAWKTVSIFMTDPRRVKKDYLPAALQTADRRWDHLRGRFGEPRAPTRRDFEIIRETADRRNMSATQIERKLMQPQVVEYSEKNRVENDFTEDMLDYNFRQIQQAANNGTKQWSNATVEPQQNEDRWYIEQRQGYQVKCHRRNARMVDRLEAERDESVGQRVDAFLEQQEREAKAREREELLRRANAVLLGYAQKRERTL